MSEESTITNLPAEKDEPSKNEKVLEGNSSNPALSSDDLSASGNAVTPAEQVNAQENRQLIENDQPEEQNKSVLGSLESNVEADQSPEQQLITSDASSESKSLVRTSEEQPSVESSESKSLVRTSEKQPSVESSESKSLVRTSEEQPSVESSESKSLVRTSDVESSSVKSTMVNESESLANANDTDQSSVKPQTSSEISPSKVPASDKGLEKVSDNIQLIYEGLKDMKISTQEVPVPASGKKGRKPPSTPRARSTPVKPLTSPPLTRSRSRDLRKFPSTPSSPKNSAIRKTSESESDEVKGTRGRPRVKKN